MTSVIWHLCKHVISPPIAGYNGDGVISLASTATNVFCCFQRCSIYIANIKFVVSHTGLFRCNNLETEATSSRCFNILIVDFEEVCILNIFLVVCSLILDKVTFYPLVENLLWRPLMVHQCSSWWLWASLCSVYHVCHGAKACNVWFILDIYCIWIFSLGQHFSFSALNFHSPAICCLWWLQFWSCLVNLGKSYHCRLLYRFQVRKS